MPIYKGSVNLTGGGEATLIATNTPPLNPVDGQVWVNRGTYISSLTQPGWFYADPGAGIDNKYIAMPGQNKDFVYAITTGGIIKKHSVENGAVVATFTSSNNNYQFIPLNDGRVLYSNSAAAVYELSSDFSAQTLLSSIDIHLGRALIAVDDENKFLFTRQEDSSRADFGVFDLNNNYQRILFIPELNNEDAGSVTFLAPGRVKKRVENGIDTYYVGFIQRYYNSSWPGGVRIHKLTYNNGVMTYVGKVAEIRGEVSNFDFDVENQVVYTSDDKNRIIKNNFSDVELWSVEYSTNTVNFSYKIDVSTDGQRVYIGGRRINGVVNANFAALNASNGSLIYNVISDASQEGNGIYGIDLQKNVAYVGTQVLESIRQINVTDGSTIINVAKPSGSVNIYNVELNAWE